MNHRDSCSVILDSIARWTEHAQLDVLERGALLTRNLSLIVGAPPNHCSISPVNLVLERWQGFPLRRCDLPFPMKIPLLPGVHFPAQVRSCRKRLLPRKDCYLARARDGYVSVLDGDARAALGRKMHRFAGHQLHFGVSAHHL